MPEKRFFWNQGLEKEVMITGTEFHHLKNVMRCNVGETVEVINGQGQLIFAQIQAMTKEKAFLDVHHVHQEEAPSVSHTLAQACLRPSKMEWVIEKGTELGIDAFWLFPAVHSEVKMYSDKQKTRFQTILISALKQSGRLFLPKVIYQESLISWQKMPNQNIFYGDVDAISPFSPAKDEDICFCIGPEKGFTDDEKNTLSKQGATPVSLAPYTLRTETAALAAAASLGLTRNSLKRFNFNKNVVLTAQKGDL